MPVLTKKIDYAAHYTQFIHDIIPVKDLKDENGSPITPFFLAAKINLMFVIFVFLAVLLSPRNTITLLMGKDILTNTLSKAFVVFLLVFLWILQGGFLMFLMQIAPSFP